MGGFFGVASKDDCITDLYYGTDYHSHLGTMRGGMASVNKGKLGFDRYIHDIRTTQFRSKFEDDVERMSGNYGIGVISDFDDQPLLIVSHLGKYSIVTVGRINNIKELAESAFNEKGGHFAEVTEGEVNPTELVASLINSKENFTEGIRYAQDQIEGSCSLLILTKDGVYAARDKYGRTPIVIGSKAGSFAATMESCSFFNLDYTHKKDLTPGEIVLMTEDGIEQLYAGGKEMKMCSFLWVYYGYPASTYEGRNVEESRNACGAKLAAQENIDVDTICGIPDSGIGHGLGYAAASGVPYRRTFVKYTPTWPRSFMPQNQNARNLVARMKLIPVTQLIKDRKLLFCEDSIVRGTQLRDNIKRVFETGAKEVHMRAACPPLLFGCPYLNFSRSKSVLDLIARRKINEMEGAEVEPPAEYLDPDSDKHKEMCRRIAEHLGITSVKYQRLDDLLDAIGIGEEKLCTYCWNKKG
ncbi:MAG: amidophosphoribosyltransferase [Kiritimatiellae bacterium]|jgi:amidophosphoribosyltransferase|nr:amidophosphoribosyltransferase [Kiritimatiellia bacterium]